MRQHILIALMAEREALFFGHLAKRLAADGFTVSFLTFHEAADGYLERHGLPYHSLHKMLDGPRPVIGETGSLESEFGIEHLRRVYRHEMLMTRRDDEAQHIAKTATYLRLFDELLGKNAFTCIVQELGGFIAPQALFYAAKKRGIPHLFIEPAMFPKRLVYTRDSLYADLPPAKDAIVVPPEVKRHVQDYHASKPVVVPHKDRMAFADMTLGRLLSPYNFRRLFRKLYLKYVARQREEYDAIFSYVGIHVSRWFRRKALAPFYDRPREGEKYVYFPFHVPWDFQLTVRCPEYLNQEALVEHLAYSLPNGYKLYVKEHPAAIGAHSLRRLNGVFRTPNVRLLHPRYNSFDLIRNADAVVTINSKVGLEALMQAKPVIVLGKAYYRGQGVTVDVEALDDLPARLREALASRPSMPAIEEMFARIWDWSTPGELYENSDANLEKCYVSLRECLLNVLAPAADFATRRTADR